MRIEWEEKFSVGVKRFDEQHKKLFKIIHDLYEAIKQKKGVEKQSEFLEALVDYTFTHLADEEIALSENGYPDLGAHKKEHDEMKVKTRDYHERHKAGTAIVSLALLEFVNDWWRNHISKTDKKYSSFLIEKGVK